LRSGVPNKDTVARLKSNVLAPKNTFWAGQNTNSISAVYYCMPQLHNMRILH